MSRWQPPHPAATIRQRPCPSGRPRYATRDLALDALTPGLAVAGLTVTGCDLCGGAHHTAR